MIFSGLPFSSSSETPSCETGEKHLQHSHKIRLIASIPRGTASRGLGSADSVRSWWKVVSRQERYWAERLE